jgi:hypothetical protein
MKLNYALLCDQAFLSIDRKVNIIGVFETINASAFPVNHPKFTLVGSMEPSKNQFKMAVDIVADKNGESILKEPQERAVTLPERERTTHFNFIVDVINTTFTEMGNYKVKVLIDEKVVAELPLSVSKTELVS